MSIFRKMKLKKKYFIIFWAIAIIVSKKYLCGIDPMVYTVIVWRSSWIVPTMSTLMSDWYVLHFVFVFERKTKKQKKMERRNEARDELIAENIRLQQERLAEAARLAAIRVHSRLKCLGGVPVLWSKWPLASSFATSHKNMSPSMPTSLFNVFFIRMNPWKFGE